MTQQTWIIGSDPSCDLVVDNMTVSKRHCRLVRDGSTLTLEDFQSTNGTYVNGQRLEASKTVTRADRITLGQTQPMPWPDELSASESRDDSARASAGPEDEQVITIGRASNNTLVLNESNVSSFHVRLTVTASEIVLEDLGSTNGTSVGKVENKIQRAVVRMSDTIYFGSTAYRVVDLVARAQPIAKKSLISGAPLQEVTSSAWLTRVQTRGGLAALGAAVLGTVVLILAAWLILRDRSSAPAGKGSTAVAAQNSAVPAKKSDEPAPKSAGTSQAAHDGSEASGDSPKALTAEEQRARALFIIVCSDPQRQQSFRIGTAFAVDSEHVATSASAIYAMRELQENGFPQAMLYCPSTRDELKIVSARVHTQFKIANVEALAAQKTHDAIYDQLEANPPKPDALEATKKQLFSERLKAIEAMQRKTACDVGIITVPQPLSHWLAIADPGVSLRPKLKLSIIGYAIDVEDPFFDPEAPMEVATFSNRVVQVSRWSDDSPKRLLASCSEQQMEYSYLGSPAVNAQGQVVAVYSRPTPSQGDANDSKRAQTFDAPLFERIRECLADRP